MANSVDYFKPVIEAFESVLHALNKLCLHIHDDLLDYPVRVDNGHQQFVHERDRVIYALKHLSPIMDLTPQETFACPGVVGATEETFSLIDIVNQEKDVFKKVVKNYLDIFKANPTKPVRHVLASAGYGGVKLKQIYRHIQHLNFHPRRVGWTKGKLNSSVIISKSQAIEMLRKAGNGEHIEIQLAKVSLLSDKDKLVIYRQIKPGWIANASTFKNALGYSQTYRIRTSLPLFYLHNNNEDFPNVSYSKKTNRSESCERSDKQIQNIPFLKSISAYRYR
jgi:hypothetical protein